MKKLFTNDHFFLASAFIAAIGTLFFNFVMIFLYTGTTQIFFVNMICAICALLVYFSYDAHAKNVMKGMMGALLMALLLKAMMMISYNSIPADTTFSYITLILSAVLFINHFLINGSRDPSPANVKLNQVTCIALAACRLVWDLMQLPYCANLLDSVSTVVLAVSWPFLYAVVVCVESRLDAYRTDRSAAGWTIDAGYPEEYDRTKNYESIK